MVGHASLVEHTAEASQGNPHAVRTAGPSKLAATPHMRLKIDKDSGNPSPLEPPLQGWQHRLEVGEDLGMVGGTAIGWNEMRERILINMPPLRRFFSVSTNRPLW